MNAEAHHLIAASTGVSSAGPSEPASNAISRSLRPQSDLHEKSERHKHVPWPLHDTRDLGHESQPCLFGCWVHGIGKRRPALCQHGLQQGFRIPFHQPIEHLRRRADIGGSIFALQDKRRGLSAAPDMRFSAVAADLPMEASSATASQRLAIRGGKVNMPDFSGYGFG